MRPHVRNYLLAFGYSQDEPIFCEICKKLAVDIHHVEPRSKFGSKNHVDMDAPNNLVALCRKCHNDAHGPASRDVKQQLKEIVSKRKVNLTIGP